MHQQDREVIHGCHGCCDVQGRWLGTPAERQRRNPVTRLRNWLRSNPVWRGRVDGMLFTLLVVQAIRLLAGWLA